MHQTSSPWMCARGALMTCTGRYVPVAESACVRQTNGHIVGVCVCRTVAVHNRSVTACVRLGNCHPAPRVGVQAGAEAQEEDSAGSPSSGLRLLHADCGASPEPQFPHQQENPSTHLVGLLKDTATVVYRGRLAQCSAHS